MRDRIAILISFCLLASVTWGQQQAQPSTREMEMPGPDTSNMPLKDRPMDAEKDSAKGSDASRHAMQSMEEHMDMGPHMKMTTLRPSKPGDAARARQVVEAARRASQKYVDYHAALADGYKIFHPELPQKMYHFTNYGYAMESTLRFNPEHPTSLLYEKRGNDYELIGAMYTAPKRLSDDQLDERIPLSIAQWHEHVNFCAPPPEQRKEMLAPHPQFGLRGSITTQEACVAAGGTFHPVIFNWMVHVYPFEKEQASIWSVDRQHGDGD
jgi:hypothetical protein